MSDLKVRDKRFSGIENRIGKMQTRAKEFSQTRSNHQLASFVGEDEYTPITKFKHIAHNSYVMMQEIRRMVIDRERKSREIERKQHRFDKFQDGNINVAPFKEGECVGDYDLDIYELTRQLEDIEIRIKGMSHEVDYMENMCDALEKENGKPFTFDQYQQEEPIYWRKRISSQMHTSQLGMQLGVGEGNYRTYLQSLSKPILDDGQQILPIDIGDTNALATTALTGCPGIEEVMLKKIEKPKEKE